MIPHDFKGFYNSHVNVHSRYVYRVIQIAAFWLFIAPQAFSGSIWLDFDENAKKIQSG